MDSSFISILHQKQSSQCVDCKIRILSPDKVVSGHSHLNLYFRQTERMAWQNQKEWKKDFFFGEYHVLPIMVVSQDLFTSHTYNVYIEVGGAETKYFWFLVENSIFDLLR